MATKEYRTVFALTTTTPGGGTSLHRPGSYAFTGDGSSSFYVKDTNGNDVYCNLDYPYKLWVTGRLQNRSWFTVVNENDDKTKVTLTDSRTLPNTAECVFDYYYVPNST